MFHCLLRQTYPNSANKAEPPSCLALRAKVFFFFFFVNLHVHACLLLCFLLRSTTRFVVTLTGAGDEFAKDASSDLEEEEEEVEKEGPRKVEKKAARVSALSRLSRFNSQAVEEAMVEGEEVTEENMEEG